MEASEMNLADGEYTGEVTMEGGSGRASIQSPTELTIENGQAQAEIVWSSSHYDYMMVNGDKYLPVNTEGNSTFEIPVSVFDEPMTVIGDTTAMSVPHEVEYTLTFASESVASVQSSGGNGMGGAAIAIVLSHVVEAVSSMIKLRRKRRMIYKMKKLILLFIVTGILVGMVTACGSAADGTQKTHDTEISQQLTFDHSETLDYAQKFSIDRYQDDYALVTITDDSRYLVVPEGKAAPDDLDPDIVVIQQPVQNIYLAASAAMDMFVSLDALDSIRFSSLKADGWYIDEAKQAMEAGDILYAGKYSTPDYEKIVEQNCGLAIENTMILHTPEVKEQLEKFGIHVLVDYSSYEPEPLGRTEWVKLYGLLTGHEAQADKAFAEEKSAFEEVKNSVADEAAQEPKTVAFFYITSNGQANVRKSADYLPKMIELAGGRYIFDSLGDEDDATSTMSMQMEEFYAGAKDADYIIYNSTIEGELSSVDDLMAKSPLFEKFKAVQEGHVYCTSKNLYQSTMSLGTITSDIRRMLTGDDADLTYIYKLE